MTWSFLDRLQTCPTNLGTRTKIVATVGPATCSRSALTALVEAGAHVLRLNMAHGTRAEHDRAVAIIRELGSRFGPLGILVDLAGPKIRLGELVRDPTTCQVDAEFRFVDEGEQRGPADLVTNYRPLVAELQVGNHVLMADGTVRLVVVDKSPQSVTCRVAEPGLIRSRQGVTLPGAALSLPALTDQDRECVKWAAGQDIDFIGLSFVRRADDVRQLAEALEQAGRKVPVIAKIEKREALEQLDSIVKAAFGVMVARGDLGVEIDVAEVPAVQKEIIRTCNRWQRPVIVATQMLDGMQHSPRPTRAEASDVANAILDGADACMLSGETAIGQYPAEAVRTMKRIMEKTEPLLADRPPRAPSGESMTGAHPITQSVVFGAGRIAAHLGAKMMAIVTRTGATALTTSSQRHFVPTIAASQDPRVLHRLTLLWGVTPIAAAPGKSPEEFQRFIVAWGRDQGILHPGDRIVQVTGSQISPHCHNLVMVAEA
jgi:pyruvate kinase